MGGWLALLLPLVLGLTGCAIPLGPQPTATPQLFRSYREYHLRNPYPEDITAGPDGAVWFTEAGAAQIGRISPEGGITEFPIPAVHSGPWAITAGPDNAVWFTDRGSDQIGRITTAGKVTEFALGGPPYAAVLEDITAGPDGALWFTETTDTYNTPGHAIGRITPTSKVTQFLLPTLNASPQGITLGPDGALWFTESGASRIGRITPTGEVTESLPTVTPGTSPAGRTARCGSRTPAPTRSGASRWLGISVSSPIRPATNCGTSRRPRMAPSGLRRRAALCSGALRCPVSSPGSTSRRVAKGGKFCHSRRIHAASR